MSKATTGKGYLRLANELAEQFAVRAFKAQEMAILFVVMRYTYGYNVDAQALTPSQFAEASGIDVSDVRKHLKALLGAGVLRKKASGIGINPAIDEWEIPLRKEGKFPSLSGEIPLTGKGNPPHESGEIPLENRGKVPLAARLNAAADADSSGPKDMKDMKDNHDPLTHGGQEGGGVAPFSTVVRAAEWFDGEGDRLAALWRRPNLATLVGLPLAEDAKGKIREYLAFPVGLRREAWAYLDETLKAGEHVNRPLAWLLAWMLDPSKFKEHEKPKGNVVAFPGGPAKPAKEPWEDYMLKGRQAHSQDEIAQALIDKSKSLHHQGVPYDLAEVRRRADADARACGRWMFEFLIEFDRKRRQEQSHG